MSRLSDFNHGVVRRDLRVLGSQGKNLRLIMPRKATFALIFLAGVSVLCAQEMSPEAISHRVKFLFERAAKAVVKIHGVDEHGPICGTGFFIDPTGTLYTAYDVGGEAGDFTVEYGGKKYPARPLLGEICSGAGLVKIYPGTPPVS